MKRFNKESSIIDEWFTSRDESQCKASQKQRNVWCIARTCHCTPFSFEDAVTHRHTRASWGSGVWYVAFTHSTVSLTELALSEAGKGCALLTLMSVPAASLRLSSHQHDANLGLTLRDLSGGLIPFVGEGGREGWMIYWLLYKSSARLVISFQDAVMRFCSVFSPRWCDFVPDIIMLLLLLLLASLCLHAVLFVCAPHALQHARHRCFHCSSYVMIPTKWCLSTSNGSLVTDIE